MKQPLIINSQTFAKKANSVLSRLGERLFKLNNDNWGTTSLIKEVFYPALEKKLSLKCKTEYLHLDAVYFSKLRPRSDDPAFLLLALEHENIAGDSCHEMSKLSAVFASLKVLITYPHCYYNPNAPSSEDLEKKYAKQLHTAGVIAKKMELGGCFNKQEHLVVFGRAEAKKMQYEYRLYQNSKPTKDHPNGKFIDVPKK